MIDNQWTTIDKSKWGHGEWQDEPDKVQFADEETGFPCLIVRNPGPGNLCGYVGVVEGHPFFEVEYQDIDYEKVDCHGGLTFTAKCTPGNPPEKGICHAVEEGEDDNVWWLGFDCAHSGDFSPGWNDPGSGGPRENFTAGGHYKSIEYVKGQCRHLAEQLMAATQDAVPA